MAQLRRIPPLGEPLKPTHLNSRKLRAFGGLREAAQLNSCGSQGRSTWRSISLRAAKACWGVYTIRKRLSQAIAGKDVPAHMPDRLPDLINRLAAEAARKTKAPAVAPILHDVSPTDLPKLKGIRPPRNGSLRDEQRSKLRRNGYIASILVEGWSIRRSWLRTGRRPSCDAAFPTLDVSRETAGPAHRSIGQEQHAAAYASSNLPVA